MSDKNEPMDESIQPKVNSRINPRESGLIKFLSAPGDLLTGKNFLKSCIIAQLLRV